MLQLLQHNMWLLVVSALLPYRVADILVKPLDVVITAAMTMDPCPVALTVSAGCSWGSACRTKEGQDTGCPTPVFQGKKLLTQQQYPGSQSSWEQPQRKSSKEVAGLSSRI